MKIFRVLISAIAFLALGITASAQQATTGPPQGGAPVSLPNGKVAVINTTVFYTQLAEFKIKLEELNRQFEPRIKDLEGKGDRITALETTLQTQGNALTPAKVAEFNEQLQKLKRDYQRQQEDLQADGQRAREQAFAPLDEKLGKFAEAYAAKKGIILLVDLANAVNSNTIVWYDTRSDVTQDFVNEYNKANPAPAGATKPAGQKQ